jgi:phytoene/squalene synthetase
VAGEILLANAAAAIPVLEARLRDGERDTRQAVVGLLAKMQGIDEVADAARMALRDIVREGSGELERLAREALSE